MKSYGLDIIDAKRWKDAQTDYYQNQIVEKYYRFVNNNKIPKNQFDRDLFVEHFLRECDYTFRLDADYVSFSEFWAKESGSAEQDINIGYFYTVATASEDLVYYEWRDK